MKNYNKIYTYRLRIAIKGTIPLIWRLIEVPSNISLEKLHHILQLSFGWDNAEDFEFTALGYTICNHDFNETKEIILAKEVEIKDVFTSIKDKIYYNYNLFNNWNHVIRLDGIFPFSGKTVKCLIGKNASPLDEAGSVIGHNNLVRAFFSNNSIIRQQLEYINEDFNPLYFNILETNLKLLKLESYIRSWEKIRAKV